MFGSILVVGGGSAGWITANVLNAALNGGPRDAPLRVPIALVESPDIPIIGVGEATVPSIRRTLQAIGLTEAEFMTACEATFKTLIRFEDWNLGARFDHPFDRRARPQTDPAVATWARAAGPRPPFDATFSLLSALADAHRAPKAIGWPDFGSTFPYAYHLDAVKLAARLSEHGRARGVAHHLGSVVQATLATSDQIASLTTDRGEQLSADLFVDCTGFAARLIGAVLHEPVVDYGRHLLCDRAVTLRAPYDRHRPPRLRPYTVARAHAAGWSWDIPLRTRRGVGHVYASAFQTPDAAETALRLAEGDHAGDLPAHHIRFVSTKRARAWVGNCVAVGLADGFLEPLESSGLYMIEHAAHLLAELAPAAALAPQAVRNRFNISMGALYEEVLSFLNLHYVTSKRSDSPFWRAATAPEAIVPVLADRLELWRARRPTDLDFDRAGRLFSLESYEYVLFGMEHCRDVSEGPSVAPPDLSPLRAKCLDKLPNHEDWLATLA